LFPSASRTNPHWNVDVLRGAYFDLHQSDDSDDGSSSGSNSNIPPLPIVEFTHDSQTTGHVLIRLQGYPLPNHEFLTGHSPRPITLVFDACFRNKEML
jgi:hypothetical protein